MAITMNRVLVTGGAGFIGSHLCEHLLRSGRRVMVVDDLDDFYDPQLKRANLEAMKSAGDYDFYAVDIRDSSRLEQVFQTAQPNAVIHLAARAGVRPSLLYPALYTSVNVDGTLCLLELSRKYEVQRFVFASSSSVYGQFNRVPFSEDDPTSKPLSVYAATKAAGEGLAFTYSHLYQLPIICLRIFTAFGPRQRPDLAIRKFAQLIQEGKELPVFGDGSMSRDYTYVTDVVSAIELALECDYPFEIFNVGNSHPVRLDYMIETLESAFGKKARRILLPTAPGDMPVTFASLEKSRRLLGYSPKVSFEEGMRLFVDWFRGQ
ncbi:MAG: SDR family NAD(P)-dependent oxidoreductase [Terriglobia bacterium]